MLPLIFSAANAKFKNRFSIFFFSIFFIACNFFFLPSLLAQPTISLSDAIGSNGGEGISDLIISSNGDIIFVGVVGDSVNGDVDCVLHGNGDVWLVRITESGSIVSQKCFGGSESEETYQIIETVDGGFLFTARTFSNDGDVSGNHSTNADIWVVKLDSDFNMQWQRCIGSLGYESTYTIIQLKNSKYLLSCYTFGVGGDFPIKYGYGFNNDAWLTWINTDGTIDTSLIYGGSGDDYISEVIELPDGALQCFGYTSSADYDLAGTTPNGNWDVWVFKIDSVGNIKWTNRWGSSGNEGLVSAVQLDNNQFLAAGSRGNDDVWILKLDSLGNNLSENYYGGSSIESIDGQRRLTPTDNGLFTIGAWATSSDGDVGINYGMIDFWMLTVDSNGILLSSKDVGGSQYDYCLGIAAGQNSAMLGGQTSSNDFDVQNFHGGSADGWLVKLDGINLS
ncbi:MAG: hypothetical protein LH473_09610, partial [Chitinophagales bacterium]|nr:hypothetical protein [Chitinophagales bacterium]